MTSDAPAAGSAPDYDRLIDAQTWAFIRKTEASYPPDAASDGVARNRAHYDAMCRAFYVGRPESVVAEDTEIAGVSVRVYTGPNGGAAMVVYFHGGGFTLGGLDSHDDVCAEICAATRLRVIAVDYRLAPEHLHPAPLEDALAVIRVVAEDQPLVLVGDSAGGNLAACASHALRGQGVRIAGQVLIYPALGGDTNADSYVTHANAPLLTTADIVYCSGIRHVGGTAPPPDPSFSPLADTDFAGLPPTVSFGAECDPLADDGRHYAARISAAGGKARHIHERGLVHGNLRARNSVDRARDSFARITGAVSTLAHGAWLD